VSTVFDTSRSYGLLGVNGAGKTTTLRLIAGTELPNSGTVRRSVRVSWPLGFAGGFHPLMSGRENVHFVARVYGADVRRVTNFVEDFAELGEYIDLPFKTYSSGMMARLAFGLSMAIEFDVYLVDEITAVGDARFQNRCQPWTSDGFRASWGNACDRAGDTDLAFHDLRETAWRSQGESNPCFSLEGKYRLIPDVYPKLLEIEIEPKYLVLWPKLRARTFSASYS
jgi:hypothetical protein